MRKLTSVAAAFTLAMGTVLAVGAPADADTAGCVTKREFGRVAKGWSKARVHRVFDTRGTQSAFFGASSFSPAEEWREYRACRNPQYSMVQVDYEKRAGVWRVSDKTAFWG